MPPSSDVSGPVIAFCTALLISNSSVRSKGVICPSSRLPLRRTPTRTTVYTAQRTQGDVEQGVPTGRDHALLGRRWRYRNRGVLRRTQISCDLILVDRPHHHFEQQVIATAVKLDRLGHILILLFEGLIVRSDVQRELAALGIGLLQLQADGRNRLWLGTLPQCELIVIPVALVLQDLQIIPRMRDQAALDSEVANGTLQLGFCSFKFRLGCPQIGPHAADV